MGVHTCLVVGVVMASLGTFFLCLAFAPLYECEGAGCQSPYRGIEYGTNRFKAQFAMHVIGAVLILIATILIGVSCCSSCGRSCGFLACNMVLAIIAFSCALVAMSLYAKYCAETPGGEDSWGGMLAALVLGTLFCMATMICTICALAMS